MPLSLVTTQPHRHVQTRRCARGCDAGGCRCQEDGRIVADHGTPATMPVYPGHQDAVGLIRGEWPTLLPASQAFLDAYAARTGTTPPSPSRPPRSPWSAR